MLLAFLLAPEGVMGPQNSILAGRDLLEVLARAREVGIETIFAQFHASTSNDFSCSTCGSHRFRAKVSVTAFTGPLSLAEHCAQTALASVAILVTELGIQITALHCGYPVHERRHFPSLLFATSRPWRQFLQGAMSI